MLHFSNYTALLLEGFFSFFRGGEENMAGSFEFTVKESLKHTSILRVIYKACEKQFDKIIKLQGRNICLYIELHRKDWILDNCRKSIVRALKASRVLKNMEKYKLRLTDYKVTRARSQKAKVKVTWKKL